MVVGRARRFADFVVERLAGHEFGLALLSVEACMLGQPTLVADGNLAVGLLVDRDAGVAQGITRTRDLDLLDDLVVLQGEVLGECACILAVEDHVQVVGGPERAMGGARVGGDDGEALIEIVHEQGDEGVDVKDAMLVAVECRRLDAKSSAHTDLSRCPIRPASAAPEGRIACIQ